MLDVEEVVLELRLGLFYACTILIFDLSPSCDSWTNRMPQAIVRNLFFQHGHEFWSFRPRSDDAHFAAKDVDKLRQFVNTVPADPFSNARNPVIPFGRPLRPCSLGIVLHRTKFQHLERTASQARPLLSKQNG